MSTYQTLLNTLNQSVDSNKARLKVFAALIVGVIHCRSVNLSRLAAFQASEALQQSQYRKLQRFFEQWLLPWEAIAKLTLLKIPKPPKGYVLSMDRTNWKFGKTHINILTIGVVVGKVAIPIVWITLPQSTKRGNSNGRHRILLVKRLLKVMSPDDIEVLALDREFNGFDWLKFLNNKDITWVLRIKKNTKISGVHASKINRKSSQKMSIWGLKLYFGSKKINNGRTSHLYVVSNKLPPNKALKSYKKRWAIEVLFGHLKKKGFNLESTHLRERRRIDKLVAVLALAFLYTLGWGVLLKQKMSKLTAHQKRKSVFRLALDLLAELFSDPDRNHLKIREFNDWISSSDAIINFVV